MQMFFVGGVVRDRLMGLEPKDIDFLVVGATEQEMLDAGYQRVGADFPVFLDAEGVEYALARTERKTGKGYYAFETESGPQVTLEDDLKRRDLTINAMASTLDGSATFDPYGGMQDLQAKVLRHVSPAFADDPVRVLRLARFHARYGEEWTVAEETKQFCRDIKEAGELATLTRERVLREFEKAMSEKHSFLFLKTLREVDALEEVFPELTGFGDGPLRTYQSRKAKFNYAKLTALMGGDLARVFEARLNVSIEWRDYAKMFRNLTTLRTDGRVDRLYRMDAFRRKDLWEELYKDCTEAGFNVDFMMEAFKVASEVNFESLPEEARAKLKGPEVAEAIKRMREFRCQELQSAR